MGSVARRLIQTCTPHLENRPAAAKLCTNIVLCSMTPRRQLGIHVQGGTPSMLGFRLPKFDLNGCCSSATPSQRLRPCKLHPCVRRLQASKAGRQPRQEQLSRSDGRLWHGTCHAKAWIMKSGKSWQPLILEADVLERPTVERFAVEAARNPVLNAAFEELLANPDGADFRGSAGQHPSLVTDSVHYM